MTRILAVTMGALLCLMCLSVGGVRVTAQDIAPSGVADLVAQFETCEQPCFLDASPGMPLDKALGLMRSNEWTGEVEFLIQVNSERRDGILRFAWNPDTAPEWTRRVNAVPGHDWRVEDRTVTRVRLLTTYTLFDLWREVGAPDYSEMPIDTGYGSLEYRSYYHDEGFWALIRFVNCPMERHLWYYSVHFVISDEMTVAPEQLGQVVNPTRALYECNALDPSTFHRGTG